MHKHDATHADACRLARWALKCRLAGDNVSAVRYEARALALVGLAPAGQGLSIGQRGHQATDNEAFGQEARR